MEQLIVIRKNSKVFDLIAYLQDKQFIAYDTETTGLDQDCVVIGMSVCAGAEIGYYIVLSEWDKEAKKLVSLETQDTVKIFLEFLKSKSLIMHNAQFDCSRTFSNFGVELIDSVHTDTMELAHLLDENRPVGLKELAYTEFGESATAEQLAMKESIIANGGEITKSCYELYKADSELIARYGAKDTILTLHLFYKMVPELFEQKLDKFFYEEESMLLLRGPTYSMNTTGLKVDVNRIKELETKLELECLQLREEILREIQPYVKDKYPGTSDKTTFNMDSPQQMSWLLFIRLGCEFRKLTDGGRELAKEYCDGKVPYHKAAKDRFIKALTDDGKKPEKYIKCDKNTLMILSFKHAWIKKLLEYKKLDKLLTTYVCGIQKRIKYGIIHPSFLQHGTTSGRYSSREPNFQNLPRDDKRIKSCIVARDGKVFVGADYSQLEPRIFASFAKDKMLLLGFEKGQDFYSVIGIPVFNKYECSADKKAPNFFGTQFETLRTAAKKIALSATYGTTAYKLSEDPDLRDEEGHNLDTNQCQKILSDYFEAYPGVRQFMLDSHEEVMRDGYVINMFGRPRRIPAAKRIRSMFKNVKHAELPYQYRSLLNLGVNHKVQSSAAAVVNRAAISLYRAFKEEKLEAKIVLQVHDELVVECPEREQDRVKDLMKFHMENTVTLPGVKLIAEPKIGKRLSDLK